MKQNAARHVIVVGGGIGGLAAAYRLTRQNPPHRVTLLESSDRLGGVIETYRDQGLTLECGPDSLIRVKPAAMELARELGIADDMFVNTTPAARSCYTVHRGRLVPVPEGFYLMVPGRLRPWITTPLISLPGKCRALMDLVIPRGNNDDESLASFVQRRLGREVLERLAQPLVAGIYGADPEVLSLRATMPQFLDMERKHRSLVLGMRAQRASLQTQGSSGARYSLFYSFTGGLQHLSGTLEDALRGHIDLKLGTPAVAVRRGASGIWQVATTAGETLTADAVVIAMPAWRAAALLKAGQPELAASLLQTPYGSVATVNLVYDRAQVPSVPAASGFVVPHNESDALIACTFVHQKYPGRAPTNKVVLRGFIGGSGRESALAQDDGALAATCARQLGRWLDIQGDPELTLVNRYDRCMAHYTLGHQDRVRRIRDQEQQLPGLALIGNAFEGVGIPDIIAQANAAVKRLTGEAKSLARGASGLPVAHLRRK